MALRLTMRNYKSVKTAHLDLRPGLNILVGPNGSGKTCLLSSLKFLRDVFRVGAAQALARQGGSLRVYRHGQRQMSFSLTQSYGQRTYRRRKIPCQFSWQMRLAQAGPERIATIIHEIFEITGTYNNQQVRLFDFSIHRSDAQRAKIKRFLCPPAEFGRDLFSFWQTEYPDRNKKQIAEAFAAIVRNHLSGRVRDQPDRSCFPALAPFDEITSEIHWAFTFFNEYNIAPDVARASTEQLPVAQMSPNGGAVSEVIDALENRRYHKLEQVRFMEVEDMYGYDASPFYRRYYAFAPYRYPYRLFRLGRRKDAFSEALENVNRELAAAVKPITMVSVNIDPTNGRRFVVFKSENDKFYPEEVSDGTVKWLCILVSLFVPFSRVYLLEEPENFLHPWMQQRLIAIMREQAKKNKTIFFLSSHSSTIVNAAYPEEILIVKHGDQGTEIAEMHDIEAVRTVLAESDFHLGDLWVSGAIGGIPADE